MKKLFLIIISLLFCVPIFNFNLLYANAYSKKEVYLTFDDGPNATYTPEILTILKNYSIKASFFVVGINVKSNPNVLKSIYRQGHTIGVHCYKHIYKELYKNVYSFNNDLNKTLLEIENVLPYYNLKYYRFPGGSFNINPRYKEIVKSYELEIIDWNCINGDTEIKNISSEDIITTVKDTSTGKQKVVLLMHDNKKITAQTLEFVILYFKNNGYRFKKL